MIVPNPKVSIKDSVLLTEKVEGWKWSYRKYEGVVQDCCYDLLYSRWEYHILIKSYDNTSVFMTCFDDEICKKE
jgi:hypothetical protein